MALSKVEQFGELCAAAERCRLCVDLADKAPVLSPLNGTLKPRVMFIAAHNFPGPLVNSRGCLTSRCARINSSPRATSTARIKTASPTPEAGMNAAAAGGQQNPANASQPQGKGSNPCKNLDQVACTAKTGICVWKAEKTKCGRPDKTQQQSTN